MKPLLLLILLVLAGVAKPAFAEACLHAPAPRLAVGEMAVVSEAAGRLNLRALPAVDTGVEIQVYAGNQLTVIGGPSCNGLYTWWRVESENGSRGWVAEGTWENYYVIPLEDAQDPPTPFEGACLRPFNPLWCL
jgi:hypothetical protein